MDNLCPPLPAVVPLCARATTLPTQHGARFVLMLELTTGKNNTSLLMSMTMMTGCMF